ncbi:Transcriptional regulator, TetR family [Arcticibacter svalbardensis MN12-7]|uniref:Transcriptional regulator, TetR family n=1 Tax=Arcticibacter svalbardensis MN12-7 TaxID=1150600 RepID=R9GUW9_9SPHI|nr:TetR/AcrR family transcriptional regulator [Arcticibacter svalbardensis]EOR95488.1 Transcriptional regulator, TetR family [Arcticibacter svalbardensis MN12-7]
MDETLSKAERTRKFIIERTASIFNTKGYAGTSLSDLTQATGLTKGSIYGNFENKEQVALAVFDYNYARIHYTTHELINQAGSFREKLLIYSSVYHDFMERSSPTGGCPILNTAIEADDTNRLLKNRAAEAILKWKENIVKLIQEGIFAGEFKPVMDSSQIAFSIIALIEGGVMIAKVTDSQKNLDDILKTVEMLINQLTVK